MHSPTHNRIDSIRDDSVYKSVGGDKSASGTTWSMTAASSNFSKLKLKLQSQTHGLTSEQVATCMDPSAKVNAGQMKNCLSHEYERDFIIESLLNDQLHQNEKARKKSFDFRRTTKAHKGNLLATKKRLQKIKEKEMSDNFQMHAKRNSQP